MADPTDAPTSTEADGPTSAAEPRCPWCSAELPDPEARTCPSCQANLVGEVDKPLPGVTAVDLEKLAYRRAVPQKKSRIMSWISGDLDYEDVTEPIAPPGSLDRPPVEVRREMLRLERAALIADLAAEAGSITADMVMTDATDPTVAAAAIQAHLDDAAAAEAMDTGVAIAQSAEASDASVMSTESSADHPVVPDIALDPAQAADPSPTPDPSTPSA